ncbi:ABC transporter ATP-binding protein [Rhodococcus jostii]|uniref:ABC transporter ATP-binding protein n=1 Tax=Rhodococcus jostii TaxID=132919 RepID=A0ABU4CT82_RHOJO|nr:ABC transporter ATP-binding protein [Rhodococcus jostii]MDV6286798.1 ABC transporter ATP-binding protein [Rhodococcus jostii]
MSINGAAVHLPDAAASAALPTTIEPALRVRGLTVRYRDQSPAVRGIDLDVRPGEIVALLGESGSGKSSIVNALLGLLPAGGSAQTTELAFGRLRIDPRNRQQMRTIRGRQVGLIPQDCTVALDPVMRVGPQILEGVAESRKWSREQRHTRVTQLLATVGFDDPGSIARRYPHELSGGMAQRVLIALALAAQPALLIADEPSAALDTLTQATVMNRISQLAEREHIGVLMVTHDLALAAERAHRGILLDKGVIVADGDIGAIADRTAAARPHRPHRSAATTRARQGQATASAAQAVGPAGRDDSPPVLALDTVRRLYPGAGGPSGVREVTIELAPGDAVGLVGGSGAGKSTVARLLAGLEHPDAGVVRYRGRNIDELDRAQRRRYRRAVQVIAQNPFSSIDPRYSARRAIEEPLRAFGIGDRASRRDRVDELAARVQLPDALLANTPDQLSGGQCQRVAIARALAADPDVLICDEAVSALDDGTKRRIIELLAELRAQLGLTIVFITHDLSAAADLTDRLIVMHDGRVAESGPTTEVLSSPRHHYTRDLLAHTPTPRARLGDRQVRDR